MVPHPARSQIGIGDASKPHPTSSPAPFRAPFRAPFPALSPGNAGRLII